MTYIMYICFIAQERETFDSMLSIVMFRTPKIMEIQYALLTSNSWMLLFTCKCMLFLFPLLIMTCLTNDLSGVLCVRHVDMKVLAP